MTELADELRALGRDLAGSVETDRIVTAVMERIADEPMPARPSRWTTLSEQLATSLRGRARVAVAALVVLLIGLMLAPPVRAAIADFFDFGGVRVRPGPAISSAPPPPTVPAKMTLAEAERIVGFKPAVPRQLGQPDGIVVSADRRVLSMTWSRGPVRIDQFDGELALGFVKQVHGSVRYTSVAGGNALWFPRPHALQLVDRNGVGRTESARPAGPTLVWETNGTTLRLEGVKNLADAIAIAETV